MEIRYLPVDQIDPDIMPRDRLGAEPDALDELMRSIEAIGLRHPIEVFAIEPDETYRLPYGLISGWRRLMAFRRLGRPTIPCIACVPADIPAALAAMVAENEVRAPISPWEKGSFLLRLVSSGQFADAAAAVDALYPSSTRQARARLRSFAGVVDAFAHDLHTPEQLTVAQMDRLATALRLGGAEAVSALLRSTRRPGYSLAVQWEALRPALNAILTEQAEPAAGADGARPRHPRHALTLRQGVTLTRERAPNGWIIRVTGPMAKSPGLVDDIFRLVERWLQPE